MLKRIVLYYCIKTLFKDTSPVNGALVSTGGVYNVKNYKRYKEKEDYLQIGVILSAKLIEAFCHSFLNTVLFILP